MTQLLLALALALTAFDTTAAARKAPRMSRAQFEMSRAEFEFRQANPCPSNGLLEGRCTGYTIDRIIPTLCGGANDPSNMRWLTLPEAKAKARWDRIGCRGGRRLVLPGQEKSVTEAFPAGEAPAPVEAQALPPGGGPPEPPAPASAPADASSTAEGTDADSTSEAPQGVAPAEASPADPPSAAPDKPADATAPAPDASAPAASAPETDTQAEAPPAQ